MTTTDWGSGDDCEWEKHVDDTSGSTYYYNIHTGESSWEVPRRVEAFKGQDTGHDAIPNWREFIDDESGMTYYYDEKSGKSRWDKPEGFDLHQKHEEQCREEELEEQDATERHENEPARETEASKQDVLVLEIEKGESGNNEGKGRKQETETLTDASLTSKMWVKYVDGASNKPYYYNTSTRKTQWEEPKDVNGIDAISTASSVNVEYQAHLCKTRTEHLARVTQQALDPSGNLTKLNALLSGIDKKTPSEQISDGGDHAAASRTLKVEWQQHVDPQTQRYYYHNVNTGVTQWNKPDAPIISGLADWIPPEIPDSNSTAADTKTTSGANYVARAKFNRLTGKYEQLGGDDYWQNAGIASDRAGRQMSHFFDVTELEKNREEARRRKEQLKRKNIDWKKITAEKKAKKQKQRNEWLFVD